MSGQRETSFLINDSKQAQRLRSGEVSGRVERLFGVEVELKAPSETAAGSQQQQEGHWVTLRTSDGDRGSTEEAKVRSSVAIILSYVNTRVMCDSVCVCVVHGPKRALWRWFVWKLELQKGSHRFPTSLQFPKQAQHLCMCTVYTRSSCTCACTRIYMYVLTTRSLSPVHAEVHSLSVWARGCAGVCQRPAVCGAASLRVQQTPRRLGDGFPDGRPARLLSQLCTSTRNGASRSQDNC